MRNMPALITDHWAPSPALYAWARQMHIAKNMFDTCLIDFVLWHTEKQVKRANFNLAFKNWLKKELEIDSTKMKPSSFKEFQPEVNIKVASKETGRSYLDKIKRRKP